MTRLDALRSFLKRPTQDGYDAIRSHAVSQPADTEKLRVAAVTMKPKPRKAKRKQVKSSTSRISWLRGVHERQGA